MGTVWEGHDTVLDRPIAVKEVILPPGVGDEQRAELIERATREARTAARLNHRGIIAIYDAVQHDGRPWIVMELVPSRSLDDTVTEDGPLPAARVAEIGREVLSALTCAHAAGVIHRDVKPANILVGRDGRIVLTDFGIATFEEDASLTRTGMVTGSPSFIAPERVTGAQAGPASDLWSLGATLYALLTGRSPFHRDSGMAVLAALISNEQADLGQVPPEIRPVLAGLLVKDPAHRIGPDEADRMLAAVANPGAPGAPMPAGPMGGPAPGAHPAGGFTPYGGGPGDRLSGGSMSGMPLPGGPVPGGPMPGDRLSGRSVSGLPMPGGPGPGGPMPGGYGAHGGVPGDRFSGGSAPRLPLPGGPRPGNSAPGLPLPGGSAPGGPVPGGAPMGRDGGWQGAAHQQRPHPGPGPHPMGGPARPPSHGDTSPGRTALLVVAIMLVGAVVLAGGWWLLLSDSDDPGTTARDGRSSTSTSAKSRSLALASFTGPEGWSLSVPKAWQNDHTENVQFWSDAKRNVVLSVQADSGDGDPGGILRKLEMALKGEAAKKYRRLNLETRSLKAGQAADLEFTAFTATPSGEAVEVKGDYRSVIRVITTPGAVYHLQWQVRTKYWDHYEPTMQAVFKSFTAPA